MKILLLGKNGQVGWELQRALAPLGELVALGADSPAPLPADFTRPEALAATVRAVAPQLIVNAAAHTAVDKAEVEPALAQTINAAAPAVLAREAAALGAWLVHYSTDYVFDGSSDRPRDEAAPTAPLNVYGRTKLEGELAIRSSGCRHLILRTSWVYAARGGNFARTMLRLAAGRDRLEVVDDQIGAPTGADLIADLTAHAVRRLRAAPELGGTYHATAAGATSWHGYARHVIEFARAAGIALQTPPEGIVAVPSGTFATAARRPLNSRLDCSRLRQAFDLHLPDWRTGVDRMLTEVLA
ncbi:MAG: dTDP-4-dehydrorhamnose reductase [Burkholderiales bacterium]|nr:dTDP-4-dehydrorhamnose reductase [Burkholderiales bacterium]